MIVTTRDLNRLHLAGGRGPGAPSKDGWVNRRTLCGRTEPTHTVPAESDQYDTPICRRCLRIANFRAVRAAKAITERVEGLPTTHDHEHELVR